MRKPEKLVFATNNAHKLDEARSILSGKGEGAIKIMSLKQIGCTEDVVEDADTLEGNALLKARWVSSHYGCDCFADDTGLEVEALGGEPGVRTARFAAMHNPQATSHDSDANMHLLLKLLEGNENRNARFRTVVALIMGGKEYVFEGKVEGTIALAPCGKEGFGYDPVFVPYGYKKTFAQMSPEQKNSMSHRGRAIEAMMQLFDK